RAMVAPRLLVSRDLVAGTAPISWRGGRVWLDWSRPFALNARPSHPANVATQRDTTWQADSQGRQADAGRNCRCRARTSLAALTPGLGPGSPKAQHARVLRGATADPGAVRPPSSPRAGSAPPTRTAGAPRLPRTPAC